MNETLISNWNSVVGPKDIIFHLGDLTSEWTKILDRLNGKICLILGNHDLTSLRRERWHGYEFYMLDSCRTRGFRKGVSLLLPPFDEYLIGYKSRELVLASEHTHHSHTNNGIFFPVIVHDDVVCGNWSPWQESLKTELFRPVDGTLSVERQWKDFRQYVLNFPEWNSKKSWSLKTTPQKLVYGNKSVMYKKD